MELILQHPEDALLRLLNFAAIDPPDDDEDYDDDDLDLDDDDDLGIDEDDTVEETGLFPASDETEALEDTNYDDDDEEDDPFGELRGSELY